MSEADDLSEEESLRAEIREQIDVWPPNERRDRYRDLEPNEHRRVLRALGEDPDPDDTTRAVHEVVDTNDEPGRPLDLESLAAVRDRLDDALDGGVLDGTVDEVEDALETGAFDARLEDLFELEKDGEDRKGVYKALSRRANAADRDTGIPDDAERGQEGGGE